MRYGNPKVRDFKVMALWYNAKALDGATETFLWHAFQRHQQTDLCLVMSTSAKIAKGGPLSVVHGIYIYI